MDHSFLQQAVELARRGKPFPNPAVGCILVQNNTLLGRGFHPRAGYPHAEVFALLEAAGHVECGVAAAQAVVDSMPPHPTSALATTVQQLTRDYCADPIALIQDCCRATDEEGTTNTVTAYVTLEPCCHVGRTPPCAQSLLAAGVNRVVVGVRDPNPIVDGGGVHVLLSSSSCCPEVVVANDPACAQLIRNFAKRMTRMKEKETIVLTGKDRRQLRAIASRKQQEKTSVQVEWGGPSLLQADEAAWEQVIAEAYISPQWLETVDGLLWQHELLQVKLNRAVAKRKQADALGRRIAEVLGAHCVQSKGHGVLLYRPGLPPKLKGRDGN